MIAATTRRSLGAALLSGALLKCVRAVPAAWPLWNSYADHFLSADGRVVDRDRLSSTTSEGQAYALFFALVANDKPRFERILSWTRNNLARGDLGRCLPAWHWGKDAGGKWQVLDPNSASDADLLIAYTLFQAGRLWRRPKWSGEGKALAERIAAEEVVSIPGLGPMLLPGPKGFRPKPECYELNASYLPVQVLLGLAAELPGGPWDAIAENVPELLRGSAPHGFVLDWIAFEPGRGFATAPVPATRLLASYDAIRVYLWAGMLHPQTELRAAIFARLEGMAAYLRRRCFPPTEITVNGKAAGAAAQIGFSAAVIPFLSSLGEPSLAGKNRSRVKAGLDPKTGLYGSPARYYDQNLALFALAWEEGRFRFGEQGNLSVGWNSNA